MKEDVVQILLRALQSAPAPVDLKIDSIHPDDVQRWSDRYKIWYKDIRTHVLDNLEQTPTHNVYYQIDRLVQEATQIQGELKNPSAEKPQKGIVIGQIKKSKD